MSLLDDYGCGGGLSVDADGGGPGELHRIALRRRVGDGDCAGLVVLGVRVIDLSGVLVEYRANLLTGERRYACRTKSAGTRRLKC